MPEYELRRRDQMLYISPSGQEFVLNYNDLSRSGGKNAPVNEYAGDKKPGIQDLGEGIVSYPIICWFSGENYDQESDRFWAALTETGPGELHHPRWGNIRVLHNKPRTQQESFQDGEGRAVFTLTFFEADTESFENLIDQNTSQITQSIADDSALDIVATTPPLITKPSILRQMERAIDDGLSKVDTGFNLITGFTEETKNQITGYVDSMSSRVARLAEFPQELMTDLLVLYRLPATVVIDIEAKIDGMVKTFDTLYGAAVSTTEKYGQLFGRVSAASVAASVVAVSEATSEGEFLTRERAAQAIKILRDYKQRSAVLIEEIEAAGGFTVASEVANAIEKTAAAGLDGLIQQSIKLPSERMDILDRYVPPLDYVYQRYGSIERLGEFIDYNGLIRDDLLIIPPGRGVRYFG